MVSNAIDPLKGAVGLERGLAILRLMNGDLNGAANDRLLVECLALIGFRCNCGDLRDQLDALEREGLLRLERRAGLVVAELTRVGGEVAGGVARADGVAAPGPDCPY